MRLEFKAWIQRIEVAIATQRMLRFARNRHVTGEASIPERFAVTANLALAFLSDGRIPEAQYTAEAALEMAKELETLSELQPIDMSVQAAISKVFSILQRIVALPVAAELEKSSKHCNSDCQVNVEAGPGGPYQECYPVGCRVRVASGSVLRGFVEPTWKFHHPVQPEQLKFAGFVSVVSHVAFYHGGDVLYNLRDTGDYTWHELCVVGE
jgi:hypothetical protein